MALTLFAQLMTAHLAGAPQAPGAETLVRVDQVMLGDAVASLTYLALEQFGVERVRPPLAVCYVDQVTVSEDGKVADDHAYLLAASRRLGVTFSPPGNGVGPLLHLERFARPGAVAIGAHPNASVLGAAGMLSFPASGMDAAMVLGGEPFALPMPRVWRLFLTGELPPWVSATDAALELLRRHGLRARTGCVLEVTGPGVARLPISERALFCAMVGELGVVTTLFPADDVLLEWLTARGRASDFTALSGDEDATVDFHEELDLSGLEPLVAKPQSPANVVPVRFSETMPIGQVVIGGVGIASDRDLERVAAIVRGKSVYPGVSFDLNPPTRAHTVALADSGALSAMLSAGVRVHEATMAGAAGVGQAPQGGRASLRTAPQNFPGLSGTKDDRVFLCSAATAAISALRGVISRPSAAGDDPIASGAAERVAPSLAGAFVEPLPAASASAPPPSESGPASRIRSSTASVTPIAKGASIKPLPPLDLFPKRGELRVVLKVPDDVPVQEIAPEGIRGLSFGSNLAALGDCAFERVDITYVKRAKVAREQGGHVLVAGHHFGYGGWRDHAAFALRQLGLRVVIAKSFGGQFRRHLLNAGVLPLTFVADADYFPIEPGELLVFEDLRASLAKGPELTVRRKAQATFLTVAALSPRELSILLAGGVPTWFQQTASPSAPPSRG